MSIKSEQKYFNKCFVSLRTHNITSYQGRCYAWWTLWM